MQTKYLSVKKTRRNTNKLLLTLIVVFMSFMSFSFMSSCTEEMIEDSDNDTITAEEGSQALTNAAINCQFQNCASSPKPLPNNASASTSYSPWGSSSSKCYYVGATYNFESGYDFLNIGIGSRLSGINNYYTHWCGLLPISLTTDYSVQSEGLNSLWFENPSTNISPPDSQCAGLPNGWQGCRGSGCWACIENLKNYPKYFVNHTSCVPNLTCGDYTTGRCSANCPAPTAADK